MNENNKTFQTALKIFNGSRMKDKLNDSMSNITLKKTQFNNYCFFIDDVCSGLFIDGGLALRGFAGLFICPQGGA